MKQHPIQLDQEAERMAKVLAEKWGLPKQRFISRVLLRCLDRVYAADFQSESGIYVREYIGEMVSDTDEILNPVEVKEAA